MVIVVCAQRCTTLPWTPWHGVLFIDRSVILWVVGRYIICSAVSAVLPLAAVHLVGPSQLFSRGKRRHRRASCVRFSHDTPLQPPVFEYSPRSNDVVSPRDRGFEETSFCSCKATRARRWKRSLCSPQEVYAKWPRYDGEYLFLRHISLLPVSCSSILNESLKGAVMNTRGHDQSQFAVVVSRRAPMWIHRERGSMRMLLELNLWQVFPIKMVIHGDSIVMELLF